VNSILHLQGTIGNQAVLRLLQANAEERQAGLTGTAPSRFGHDFSQIPLHPPAAGAIQTKLAISKPGDEYEQEADRISEQVIRMPEPQLQRACACGGACPKCQTEQPGQKQERLQTKRVQAGDTGQITAPAIVREVLAAPGQPLDSATRGFMEPRFGQDFSKLRVHTDARAAESAKAIGAHAYTVGSHIVFGAGRYEPLSSFGGALLAHELAHVVQQSGSSESTELSAAGHIAVAQRTRAPMLQGFWVTTEPAGGCGICYGELSSKAPAAAGIMAHHVIQSAFIGELTQLYRLVEFPYSSPTDDNGRLDLAIATPTGFKIGEIKPANKDGEDQGVKDLDWYRTTLQAAYPLSTIEMMDVHAPGSGLKMPDLLATLSGCQSQTLGVTAMRPGLYGYWCQPPFSVARRICPCRPGSTEGETVTEIDAIQTSFDVAAVTARLAGEVEVAIRFEAISSAIAAGVIRTAAVATTVVEDVGLLARFIMFLQAAEE